MNLKKYVCGTKSILPRGAVSRVMEHVGCSFPRAVKLIYGATEPTVREQTLITDFITRKMPISAGKTGPQARAVKKLSSVSHR